jgi:DNA modification methylase
MQLLGLEKPNLMITDPPYGVNYDPMWRDNLKRANGTRTKVKADRAVTNDDEADWTPAWKLFTGDVAYVWHGDSNGSAIVEQSLKAAGFGIRATIIWDKTRLYIGRGHYQAQHEPCKYCVRMGKAGNWHGDRKQSTVWSIPVPKGWEQERDEKGDEHTRHSTQKPVECFIRPMLNNSVKGDAIYDPFCGSGTSIIAGQRHGRRVFAMEIDPVFVDVIVQRWEKETGQKAVLHSTGKTYDEMKRERLPDANAQGPLKK